LPQSTEKIVVALQKDALQVKIPYGRQIEQKLAALQSVLGEEKFL